MKYAFLIAILAFGSGIALAAEVKPPNFVFIVIDDMGWKDIGANCSTYYKTPNIDRLATDGMRFTQAYSACAVCSPSRAAIMSGKSPARLHLTDWISGEKAPQSSRFTLPDWSKTLAPSPLSLPALLQKAGYTTASIGKWHLGNDAPEAHGFDKNIGGNGRVGHPASFFHPYGKSGASHRVPMLAETGGKEGDYLTDRLTDEATHFIKTNADKPFFLYLAHYAVHSPLMAKEKDIEEFKSVPSDGRQDFPLYAAMVKSVDDSVGRIRSQLEASGLKDNTVIVFTSDNGGVVHFKATNNSPLRAGKGFPYEGGIRVPLLISAPGLTKAGTINHTPVIGTDFLKTITRIAGIESPPGDGVDLYPVLQSKPIERDTFTWHYPHYWAGGMITPYSVIRSGNWKLIRWYEFDEVELYDLHNDPSEKTNLATNHAAQAKILSDKLAEILTEQGAQMPILRNPPSSVNPPPLNRAQDPKYFAD